MFKYPQKYGEKSTGYKMNVSLFFILSVEMYFVLITKKHEGLTSGCTQKRM